MTTEIDRTNAAYWAQPCRETLEAHMKAKAAQEAKNSQKANNPVTDLSIEAELAALGYGHRRLPASSTTGEHEVYRLADNHVIGRARAHEALELARAAGKEG